MALISAAEAFQRTMTKDKKVASTIAELEEKFNSQVSKTAAGDESHAGETFMYFHISATTDLLMHARDTFVAKIRAACYKVTLHHSNDDNDHFIYHVDWS